MGEQLICILAILVGVIFFSSTIGALTSILSNYDVKSIIYEGKINVLDRIRSQYKISPKLFQILTKVLKYDVYKSDPNNFKDFMNELPESLQIDLGYYIYKRMARHISMFTSENISIKKNLIAKLGPFLRQVQFIANEIVFSEDESASEMFFIKSGSVSYVYDEEESKEKNIRFFPVNDGDYFGEIDMIFG